MTNINAIIATIANINASSKKLIIDELEKHNLKGLSPSHGDILIELYLHEEGIVMNKITAAINKDKSTVTALVNKLEKLKLLEKFKNKNDSRSIMVKLTKKGFDTKKIVLDIISPKLLNTTYKDFTKEEQEILCKLLDKIKNNFLLKE